MKVSRVFSFLMLNLVLVVGCFGGGGRSFDNDDPFRLCLFLDGWEWLKEIREREGDEYIKTKRDQFDNTYLHHAASHGRKKCVKNLLKWGSDCSIKNNEGRNVLHKAAYSRIVPGGVIKKLMKSWG